MNAINPQLRAASAMRQAAQQHAQAAQEIASLTPVALSKSASAPTPLVEPSVLALSMVDTDPIANSVQRIAALAAYRLNATLFRQADENTEQLLHLIA